MSSLWNNGISISLFGESHGKAIGVVVDNLPAGETIDMDQIQAFMARRAPGKDLTATQRMEKDVPVILSGLLKNTTTGAPLAAMIENNDTHSSDYTQMQTKARPGHADYTGFLRYHGYNDVRGSGHFSGRITAPLVFAGAVCAQILERRGIVTGGHILSIRGIADNPFDPVKISAETLMNIRKKTFPVIDPNAERQMRNEIEKARLDLDSVGGIIELCTVGFPAGIGSPMFDGLENCLSSILFGIPAVKGVVFGAGFEVENMLGSENNDAFFIDEDGEIRTKTNFHGGILGGISSGMPLHIRIAVKPTSSIGKRQDTVDFVNHMDTSLSVQGRHDPCIVPRAVPVAEAAVNIALLGQLAKSGLK